MTDCEAQIQNPKKLWTLTTEGVFWLSALWLSICSNLTLLFGLENVLVSKHISGTFVATSLVLTFLLYLNHSQKCCMLGQDKFSALTYTIIASFGIFANFFSALLIYSNSEETGLACFNSLEMVVLGLIYILILFYRSPSGQEMIDKVVDGCINEPEDK